MDSFPLDIIDYLLQFAFTNADYLSIALVCKRWRNVYLRYRNTLEPWDERGVFPSKKPKPTMTKFHFTVYRVAAFINGQTRGHIEGLPIETLCQVVSKYAVINDGLPNSWMCVALMLHAKHFYPRMGQNGYLPIRGDVTIDPMGIALIRSMGFPPGNPEKEEGISFEWRHWRPINFWYYLYHTHDELMGPFSHIVTLFNVTTNPPAVHANTLANQMIKLFAVPPSITSPCLSMSELTHDLCVRIYLAGGTSIVRLLATTYNIRDECTNHQLVRLDLQNYLHAKSLPGSSELSRARSRHRAILSSINCIGYCNYNRMTEFAKKIVETVHNRRSLEDLVSTDAEEIDVIRALRQHCPELFPPDFLDFETSWKMNLASADMLARDGYITEHFDALMTMCQPIKLSKLGNIFGEERLDNPDKAISLDALVCNILAKLTDKTLQASFLSRVISTVSNAGTRGTETGVFFTGNPLHAAGTYINFPCIRKLMIEHNLTLPPSIFDLKTLLSLAASKAVKLVANDGADGWHDFMAAVAEKSSGQFLQGVDQHLGYRWHINKLIGCNFSYQDAAELFETMLANYDEDPSDYDSYRQIGNPPWHNCRGTKAGLIVLAVYIMSCKLTNQDPMPALQRYDSTACTECANQVDELYRQLGWRDAMTPKRKVLRADERAWKKRKM